MIEKELGRKFIRIKQNIVIFFVEISKIHHRIIEPIKKLTKKVFILQDFKKTIKNRPKPEENYSVKSKCLKFIVKKILSFLEKMQTFCLRCKRHTNNIGSKTVIMRNKIRDKSRCANSMFDKSRFLKHEHNKKSGWNNISVNYSFNTHYKTC